MCRFFQSKKKQKDICDYRNITLPLTPDDNLNGKEYAEYERFLNAIFSNDSLKNVAISGGYGIGKSSIIHSFEKRNNKKFLYISLLENEDNSNYDKLEITIFRQILANCVRKEFPVLGFKIIPEETKAIKFKASLVAFYLFLCTCFLFSKNISNLAHFFGLNYGGYGSNVLYILFFLSTFVAIFLELFMFLSILSLRKSI